MCNSQKVNFKIFADGEKWAMAQGFQSIDSLLDKYLPTSYHAKVKRDVAQSATTRAKCNGLRLVITNPKLKDAKRGTSSGFLKVELQGKQSEAQIRVAAADKLKTPSGYHRTVCMVLANGLEYKVKCKHKGLTYTETVYRCEIVGKKVA